MCQTISSHSLKAKSVKQHQNVKAEESQWSWDDRKVVKTTWGGSSPQNYLSLTFSLIMWVDLWGLQPYSSLSLRVFSVCSRITLPHKESFCGRAQNYRPAEHDIITNHKALGTVGQPQLHSAPFPTPNTLSSLDWQKSCLFSLTTHFLFLVKIRSHYLSKSCKERQGSVRPNTHTTRFNT